MLLITLLQTDQLKRYALGNVDPDVLVHVANHESAQGNPMAIAEATGNTAFAAALARAVKSALAGGSEGDSDAGPSRRKPPGRTWAGGGGSHPSSKRQRADPPARFQEGASARGDTDAAAGRLGAAGGPPHAHAGGKSGCVGGYVGGEGIPRAQGKGSVGNRGTGANGITKRLHADRHQYHKWYREQKNNKRNDLEMVSRPARASRRASRPLQSCAFYLACLSFVLGGRGGWVGDHAAPRHATPRHATPRHATPRHYRSTTACHVGLPVNTTLCLVYRLVRNTVPVTLCRVYRLVRRRPRGPVHRAGPGDPAASSRGV